MSYQAIVQQKSEANITVKKLYVSGIRDDHTEEMLKEHFETSVSSLSRHGTDKCRSRSIGTSL